MNNIFFSLPHPAEGRSLGQLSSIFTNLKIIAHSVCTRSVMLSLPVVKKPGHLCVSSPGGSNVQPRLRTAGMFPTYYFGNKEAKSEKGFTSSLVPVTALVLEFQPKVYGLIIGRVQRSVIIKCNEC